MSFRNEIVGLRAISVISIIFFHLGYDIFNGGFIGVDIFFVISGYLITLIIVNDFVNNKFNLINFYKKRFCRIYPALLFLLIVVYLVSWFIFFPNYHKVVGQYIFSSILSITNLLLFLDNNKYFESDLASNPLLHTWSLGIEVQFYFIFSIILVWILKFKKKILLFILISFFLLSLIFSEFAWRIFPVANFYLIFSRLWEFFLGSAVALIIIRDGLKKNGFLAFIGFFLIFFSILFFNKTVPSPSIYIFIPLLGTVLILLFASNDTLVAKILGSKLFAYIGSISYSLYLWHLPLQVFIQYLFESGFYQSFLYFFLLLALSSFTYHYIEEPFRKKIPFKVLSILSILVILPLIFISLLGHFNGGFPDRSELFSNLRTNNGWGLACNGNTQIRINCAENINPNIAILGNSYAMVYVNELKKNKNYDVVQLTQDSCAVGFVDKINEKSCEKFYKEAIKNINNSNSINTVVISSPFEKEFSNKFYSNSFIDLLKGLKDKKIIIIGPTPSAPFNVAECIFKNKIYKFKECSFDVPEEHYLKINNLKKTLQNIQVTFIDITEVVCPSSKCIMKIGKNDAFYIDTGHLSLTGASKVIRNFF